jgi:predicted dehydrogenase
MLNVSIIGCGVIGGKRAEALKEIANIVSCYDINHKVSINFAEKYSCTAVSELSEVFSSKEIDAVFISTDHKSLYEISIDALSNGKNVFIEKPGAISSKELMRISQKAVEEKLRVHIGYNHRHHKAITQAIDMASEGEIGKVLFLRARYGHGGRIGYNKEWRADKLLSGGGELMDQGTHLLDLSQAFLGDLTLEYGSTPNYFWDMEVEDNAFIVVKNSNGGIGFLHVSCTEWKNTFSLEVYGEKGKIEVSGLGGSYGVEKLLFYKMLPEMGPPETYSWEYPMQDDSFSKEVSEFLRDITVNARASENLHSSIKVLQLVEEIYLESGR